MSKTDNAPHVETLERMLDADYTGLHPHEEEAIRAAIAAHRKEKP